MSIWKPRRCVTYKESRKVHFCGKVAIRFKRGSILFAFNKNVAAFDEVKITRSLSWQVATNQQHEGSCYAARKKAQLVHESIAQLSRQVDEMISTCQQGSWPEWSARLLLQCWIAKHAARCQVLHATMINCSAETSRRENYIERQNALSPVARSLNFAMCTNWNLSPYGRNNLVGMMMVPLVDEFVLLLPTTDRKDLRFILNKETVSLSYNKQRCFPRCTMSSPDLQ